MGVPNAVLFLVWKLKAAPPDRQRPIRRAVSGRNDVTRIGGIRESELRSVTLGLSRFPCCFPVADVAVRRQEDRPS